MSEEIRVAMRLAREDVSSGRRRLVAAAVATPLALINMSAQAQQRPLRVIVPFPPGGMVDILARALQGPLQEAFGQPLIVDNKPGASGVIGTAEVARAAPDGQTLAMVYDTHAVNHLLVKNIPYDPFALRSIALLALSPAVLVTGPQFSGKTVGDVIKAARSKSGAFSFGNVGLGSSNHLTAALFSDQARIKTIDVPYRGAGPLIADLIGGQVDAAFTSLAAAISQVKGGRLKLIAVAAQDRIKEFPNAETVAETLPAFRATAWVGLVGPRGLDPQTVVSYNRNVNKVLSSPAVRSRLEEYGLTAVGGMPEDFDRFLRQESIRWGKVIKDLKIEGQ